MKIKLGLVLFTALSSLQSGCSFPASYLYSKWCCLCFNNCTHFLLLLGNWSRQNALISIPCHPALKIWSVTDLNPGVFRALLLWRPGGRFDSMCWPAAKCCPPFLFYGFSISSAGGGRRSLQKNLSSCAVPLVGLHRSLWLHQTHTSTPPTPPVRRINGNHFISRSLTHASGKSSFNTSCNLCTSATNRMCLMVSELTAHWWRVSDKDDYPCSC